MADARHEKSQANRRRFIERIAQRDTLAQACAAVGVQVDTYYHWRRTDAYFKEAVDDVRRLLTNTDASGGWTGDRVSFRKTFFNHDTFWHTARMDAALDSCPPMGVTLVLLPPEHGKTTWVEDLVSEALATTPDTRVTYVSEGIGHSRKQVRRVQRRMTDNRIAPDFFCRFGPFRAETNNEEMAQPWTKDFFTVAKATHDEADYSLEARGWKSAIAGTRTDLLIIDDIQSRKSLNLSAEMLGVFQQDMLTRVGRNGRTIIIGTRVGPRDFYELLEAADLVDAVVRLPATEEGVIVDCELGRRCDHKDLAHEKPLCPELWDAHALAKRRQQVGEDVWWRNYQQRPRRSGNFTFSEDMTTRAHNVYRSIGEDPSLPPYRILTLDPALGGGNALAAWALSTETMFLMDTKRDMGLSRTEEILSGVEMFAAKYRPRAVVIETVAFQKGLGNDARLRSMAARMGFRVVPHITNLNKIDDQIGVASMDSTFLADPCGFDFPYADPASRVKTDQLCAELNVWDPTVPTRKLRQDLVMTMWFGWLEWLKIRRSMGSDYSEWNTTALPWAPSTLKAVS